MNLPANSRIHPVFHCSLLKLYQSTPSTLTLELLALSDDNHPIITPLAILDTKWENINSGKHLLVLVQWSRLLPEDTSWESWENLQKDYNLEDKVVLEAHRDVMNEDT